MVIRRWFLIPALLATCAADSNPGPVIRAYLNGKIGAPVGSIFETLGYPTSETDIAGHHVYLWQGSRQAIIFDAGVIRLTCTIRVFTEVTGMVTYYDLDGSRDACAAFAHKIDPSFPTE